MNNTTTQKALTTSQVLQQMESIMNDMVDLTTEPSQSIQNKMITKLIEICIKQEEKIKQLDKIKVSATFTANETFILNELIEDMVINDIGQPTTLKEWIDNVGDIIATIGHTDAHVRLAEKLNTTNEEVLEEIKILLFDIVRFNKIGIDEAAKQEILQSIAK